MIYAQDFWRHHMPETALHDCGVQFPAYDDAGSLGHISFISQPSQESPQVFKLTCLQVLKLTCLQVLDPLPCFLKATN